MKGCKIISMKLMHKIHLWFALFCGLIITLICFSGAMLVFEKEVTAFFQPNLYKVKSIDHQSLSFSEICNKVSETVADGQQVTGITISNDPWSTYQIHLSGGHRTSLYVDPYTGEVLGKNERLPFFQIMFRLHRWLLDVPNLSEGKMSIGKRVVGITTLMFVFILLSGIVIWFPRNYSMLKQRFSIKIKKGWKRFLYDIHVVGGMYAVILLLMLSLTGLTWSFPWYKKGFYQLFGVSVVEKKKESNRKSVDKDFYQVDVSQWQKVYETLSIQNPSYHKISISDGTVQVYLNTWGNQRTADNYKFLPETGQILSTTLYRDIDVSKKIGGWIYSIHVGSWGGLFSRFLTFLAALLGATLPLTGYYLWYKKHIVAKTKRKRI